MDLGAQQAVNFWDNIKIDLGETVFRLWNLVIWFWTGTSDWFL